MIVFFLFFDVKIKPLMSRNVHQDSESRAGYIPTRAVLAGYRSVHGTMEDKRTNWKIRMRYATGQQKIQYQ